MQTSVKEWLVRTVQGELLGPFSQVDLILQFQKKTIVEQDEICVSKGFWFSAKNLVDHDLGEMTRTSPLRETVTRKLQTKKEFEVSTSSNSSLGKEGEKNTSFVTLNKKELEKGSKKENSILLQEEQRKISFFLSNKKMKQGGIFSLVLLSFCLFYFWKIFSKPAQNQVNGIVSLNSDDKQTSASEEEVVSSFLQQISILMERGEMQLALEKLNQFHEKKKNPDEIEYLLPYSALLITEGESFTRAKRFLESLLIHPKSSPAMKAKTHHWLGYISLSLNEGDRGENHFLESLQLNPKDAASRFNLARSYLAQEKYSQALDYFQLAELEAPNLWSIHLYKGKAKAALGLMNEAKTAFRKTLQIVPDRWLVYIYFSLFLHGIDEKKEAQTLLKKMITRDPHYEVFSPPPFGFFQQKVNYLEYLQVFNLVMEKVSGEEKEVAKVYLNYLLANSSLNEAKKISLAAEKGGLFSKVLGLKTAIDRNASGEELKQILTNLPLNISDFGYYGYVLRGEAKNRLGLVAEAQVDFQQAIVMEPRSAIANWSLAMLLKKTEKKNEAFSLLQTLVSYHPTYLPALAQIHHF